MARRPGRRRRAWWREQLDGQQAQINELTRHIKKTQADLRMRLRLSYLTERFSEKEPYWQYPSAG